MTKLKDHYDEAEIVQILKEETSLDDVEIVQLTEIIVHLPFCHKEEVAQAIKKISKGTIRHC